MKYTRDNYVKLCLPPDAMKIADKLSDAVAYVYHGEKANAPCFAIFYGKQGKPVARYRCRSEAEREKLVRQYFEQRRAWIGRVADRKADTKAKTEAFRSEVEPGDIFHYSYGYDETHHVYHEVIEVKGRFAIVRKISQAQEQLGYDDRHRCMPQSGHFTSEPKRVLIQDGQIKVDRHYHATKWNTRKVAGVPMGPAYTGGGMH